MKVINKFLLSFFLIQFMYLGYSQSDTNSNDVQKKIKIDGVAAVVGDYVILSGFVAVHQFCRIGSHSFVAGGSLVRKDVPPYVKAAREPLSYVGINSVGLRRRGFDVKKVHEIQNIYRILFQKKYNNTQAMEIIQGELNATRERDEIIQFIENSQRGIMKGYFQRN